MRIDLYQALSAAIVSEYTWMHKACTVVWESFEEPPAEVVADFSSAIAFRIAAIAKRDGLPQDSWDPVRIATKLSELLRESGFSISLSPRGHLNFFATYSWYAQYYARVTAAEANWLVEELTSLAAATTSFRCVVPSFAAAFPEVLSEIVRVRPDILSTLNCSTLEVCDSRSLKLMALAMYADPELDAGAYLRGLYGRENVPWYFDAFYTAWRSVAPAQLAFVVGEEMLGVERAPMRAWREEVFCAEGIYWIATTREVLCPPIDAPIGAPYYLKLLEHLLAGIRLFFTFYNHPQNRQNAGEQSRWVVRLIGEAVEAAESAVFVS